MRKILNKIIILIFALSFVGVGIYFGQKNTPNPLPPIDKPIDNPVLPRCLEQDTLDAQLSCQIQYYPDTIQHYKPTKQPDITGTREQNNQIIWNYINDSQYKFKINSASYLVLLTKNPIVQNRDLFLGINGTTQGAIHKNSSYNFISDLSENKKDSTYIFSANRIQIKNEITRVISLNDNDTVSFAVGERNNYVTDVYVVNLQVE